MDLLPRIMVRGFKSLEDVSLELGAMTVLIGPNGAGKSNFVSLFGLLDSLVEGKLQSYVARQGGANALLRYGQRTTPEMEIGTWFRAGGALRFYSAVLAAASPDTLVLDAEGVGLYGEDQEPRIVLVGSGVPESRLEEYPGEGAAEARTVLAALKGCRRFQFHDTSEAAPVRKKGYVEDNLRLRHDAGNLAAFLFRLRHGLTGFDSYARIRDQVREVFPQFDDFILEPASENKRSILLNWRETGRDFLFGPHMISDGALRFMALCTLLLQPDESLPRVMVIDEPELGLHPYAINVLGGLIRKASRRCQVIVATQSPGLLDQFEAEDVVVVERKEEATVFRRLPGEEALGEWLKEYSLGELWEKNVLGGGPLG